MKIIWITPLLLIQSYHIFGSNLQDEYNQYSFYQNKPLSPRPLDAMADLTNDLGVCVLRVIAAGGDIGNIAFSPFGLMAVSVLLYEGSSGYSALQIKQSLNLPWEILAVRIGVRDLNRYLKTYFKSDGFLNGLTMSREEVCLRPQFKRVLQLYGFDDPNSFLVDSCPESVKTTMQPLKPVSVTTHGTILTEMTPTSQIIQISKNITNGSASETSTVSTEFPAKITYVGDATFTISSASVDTNTNTPMMNSQTNTMIVDIETQPHVKPIESSTNQMEATVLIGGQELKSSNEITVDANSINDSVAVVTTDRVDIVPKDSTMATVIITQLAQSLNFSSDTANNSQTDLMTDHTTSNRDELYTSPIVEISTVQPYENSGNDDTSNISITTTDAAFDALDEDTLTRNSYVASTKILPDNTIETTVSTPQEINSTTTTSTDDEFNESNTMNIRMENTVDTIGMTSTTNIVIMDTINENINITDDTVKITRFSTKPMFNDDGTTKMFEETTTRISEITVTDQTTPSMSTMSGQNNNDVITMSSENLMSMTKVSSVSPNLNNATESEIIKVAESNQRYQIVSLPEMKSARSMESNDNFLPTFNVEFVVRKEDLRTDCNKTRKRTIIKPDKILTEYPKNSGISITLRESKKRKRRHLEQYQEYDTTRFNRYKTYGYRPPSVSYWTDRSSQPFESANLFNNGYRRISFFTYTAVLPFGFIFELKSHAIEIPLDDPKYTLMIVMPNHPDGLSELLLMLPSISLRNIHNSLKPTAVHATIPMFKYTAKVDLTSALQQIGIRDVFYRYRADLSFMSPDARLFVSSIQQVVSVTAKKYSTPSVYEIQYKYVKQDFVVSRPFVYFVMDIHTKVSLIAGIITDPLASPIWI